MSRRRKRRKSKRDLFNPLPLQRQSSLQQVDIAALQRAVARPQLAGQNDMLALQRSYGNRAVSPLLNQARGKGAIQRFSDNDTQPGAMVDWDTETNNITKSQAGAVSGVFFFHDSGGKTLVVKPEYSGGARPTTAGQTQFADKFLQEFGFNVPQSRIIEPGGGEFEQIVNLIPQKLTFSEKTRSEIGDIDTFMSQLQAKLGGAKYFKLMQPARGESLDEIVTNANTVQAVTRVIQTLSKPAILRQIGRLIVADAILGNNDRLGVETTHKGTAFVANLGNLMISGDEISTIDSDALVESELSNIGNHNWDAMRFHSLIDAGLDQADYIFDQFLEIIKLKLQDKMAGDISLVDYFITNYDKGTALPLFKAGIKSGQDFAVELFTQEPEKMDTLEAEATKDYQSDPQNKGSVWDTFMARRQYFMSRYKGGKDIGSALKESTPYQFYRLIWSKQQPAQIRALHPLIQDKDLSYPGKSLVSKKDKGRKEANKVKVELANFLAKGKSPTKTNVEAIIQKVNSLTGDSDSAKKARFFGKSAILSYDIFQRNKEIKEEMQPELEAMANIDRSNVEIVTAAQLRKNTLAGAVTTLKAYEADYNNMVDKVKAILEKKALKKLNLDAFGGVLTEKLNQTTETLQEYETRLQTVSARIQAINPRGWRQGY